MPASAGAAYCHRYPPRRETLHPRPGCPEISAAPQPVAPCAEIENAVLVRIDGQPLAVSAAGFIAPHFERHRRPLPRVPEIGRPENFSIAGPWIGIGACGEVDAVGLDRIRGKAVNPHQIRIAPRDPVEQRPPPPRHAVPPVGSTDVGAQIDETGLGAIINDAGDIPPAADRDIAPDIRLRGDRRICQGVAQRHRAGEQRQKQRLRCDSQPGRSQRTPAFHQAAAAPVFQAGHFPIG